MLHQGDAALDIKASPVPQRPATPAIALMQRTLDGIHSIVVAAASLALIAAALALSESVLVRYFLKSSTDWQDETSVMLLVGAIFLSASYVQSVRGHVAIEAVAELLSPATDWWRVLFADGVSAAFCIFFAWKAWTLTHEAWVDGQEMASTLASPLWIPYSLMAAGMSLLGLQIAVQILAAIFDRPAR